MLCCFWSPKGGSGTSVVAAVAALVASRRGAVRLVDLAGDQPAIFGAPDPPTGVRDWLCAGPATPTEALDRLTVDATARVGLLPAGAADVAGAPAEAGAALAVALEHGTDTIVDCGTLGEHPAPALAAFVETVDASIVVVRGCYVALRRGVRSPLVSHAAGALLVAETGRALGAREVEDVLGIPVLGTVPVRGAIARAVDAGVLPARVPESLARPMRSVLRRIDARGTERAA